MIYKQPPSWLAHHGVEGQRWGVRHGPPYPLDSSVSTGSKLKGSGKKITSKKVIYDPGQIKDEERLRQAAVTGLNAYKRVEFGDQWAESINPNDKDEQIWFLYEDQTYLMPGIADLANQGFSAKEIRDYFDKKVKSINNKIDSLKKKGDDKELKNYFYTLSDGDSYIYYFWDDDPNYGLRSSNFTEKCVEYVNEKNKEDSK